MPCRAEAYPPIRLRGRLRTRAVAGNGGSHRRQLPVGESIMSSRIRGRSTGPAAAAAIRGSATAEPLCSGTLSLTRGEKWFDLSCRQLVSWRRVRRKIADRGSSQSPGRGIVVPRERPTRIRDSNRGSLFVARRRPGSTPDDMPQFGRANLLRAAPMTAEHRQAGGAGCCGRAMFAWTQAEVDRDGLLPFRWQPFAPGDCSSMLWILLRGRRALPTCLAPALFRACCAWADGELVHGVARMRFPRLPIVSRTLR